MTRAIRDLQNKVYTLWPEPTTTNIYLPEDDSKNTGYSGTAGSTFCPMWEAPYPGGSGGYMTGDVGSLDERRFTSAYKTGGATYRFWNDRTSAVTDNGNMLQPLVRPFQLLQSATTYDGVFSRRASDKIFVHGINMSVSIQPDWWSASSSWDMGANDSVYADACIMFMWVSSPLKGRLDRWMGSIANTIKERTINYTGLYYLFKNYYAKAGSNTKDLYDRDHGTFGTSANTYAGTPVDSHSDFMDCIWNSPLLNPNELTPGQRILVPPLKIHMIRKFRFKCPGREVSLTSTAGTNPLAIGSTISNTVANSGVLPWRNFVMDGPAGLRSQLKFHALHLPWQKHVEYREIPRNTDGTFAHAPWGLCMDDLSLCVISNRSSAFWRLRFKGSISWRGAQEAA